MFKLLARLKPSKEHKEIPFTIFSGFWFTYVFIRALVYVFPALFMSVKGVHVHHFSYGIIILTLVGFYSLVMNPKGNRLYKTAFLFGIGLALTYDEFGMWLQLRDDNVARWGYDMIALISVGFINLLYLDQHWVKLTKVVRNILSV